MEEELEEKKELLKREEIKTMAKDIARLREEEAQGERERIAKLKTEEEARIEREKAERSKEEIEERKRLEEEIRKKREILESVGEKTREIWEKEEKQREKFLERLRAKEKPSPEVPKPEIRKVPLDTLIPKPPPKKPSPILKILIRVAIVAFCFLIAGFGYWFLEVKKPKIEGVIPPSEEALPPSPGLEEKLEIVIPPPLISVEETRTPEISKIEEIPEALRQVIKEELPLGSFTQLVIKNLAENRLTSFEDLSLAFQIEIPEEIFQKLDPDFTLSIFNQKEGKRVVLVGKVKEKEGLNEALKNWEAKIKSEGLYVSGKKIPALVSYFRTSFYKEVGIRYLTISKTDLGICYAWFDDYFILATSFEGIKSAIDRIKVEEEVKELEKKIGQLFIIGFEGKTLTPELEDLFKKYRPGGVLLLSKNIESKEQLKSLIQDLQNLSLRETGFPLFIAVDQEGGIISRIEFIQEKTPQSEINNVQESYQIGLKRGEELKELGVNLNLAPVLDLANEGDFIFNRTFKKSATETGELARALILGQKAAGVLTAIKHFPGYGGITFHPEDTLAVLEVIPEISQFGKAMEANPEFVMTANVIYKTISPSLPFTFSPAGIQFLKSNASPEVIIISDDLAQDSLLKQFSLKETLTKPIEAGVDILIFSGWDIEVSKGLDEFYNAFKNGEVSKEKIEKAISRIIQLKQNILK